MGCTASSQTLTKVHLTNQKGLTETITNKERLKQYERVSALSKHPCKKMVRTFKKGGEAQTVITTYYPSGQIHMFLECKNNQACGNYKEWHENGCLKIQAYVSQGIADTDISAQNTWTFEGENKAFDENGQLRALFFYQNGSLEQSVKTYHANGSLKSITPYTKNKIHGEETIYNSNGELIEKNSFNMDQKNGVCQKYWESGELASDEIFENGLLMQGVYLSSSKKKLGEVKKGAGKRVFFDESGGYEVHQYQKGVPCGTVESFDEQEYLVSVFNQKEGVKEGLEQLFYPQSQQVKLEIEWVGGTIHGRVKTWYPCGQIESCKEMSFNKKQGVSTAWFQDGNLLLIEEYEGDKLIKGAYYKRGVGTPISLVVKGYGTATLHDSNGVFVKKIEYQEGKPVE